MQTHQRLRLTPAPHQHIVSMSKHLAQSGSAHKNPHQSAAEECGREPKVQLCRTPWCWLGRHRGSYLAANVFAGWSHPCSSTYSSTQMSASVRPLQRSPAQGDGSPVWMISSSWSCHIDHVRRRLPWPKPVCTRRSGSSTLTDSIFPSHNRLQRANSPWRLLCSGDQTSRC